jgi:hypothetical protein
MTTKHMPGPWRTDKRAHDDETVVVLGDDGWLLIDIPATLGSETGKARREANAHLIAAAPDLLEALEKIVTCCRVDRELSPDVEFWLPKAEAAIRKAKGE